MNTITSSQLQYKLFKVVGVFFLLIFIIEPLFYKFAIVEWKMFGYFENYKNIGLISIVLLYLFIGYWIALNKSFSALNAWKDYVYHFTTEIFIVCWVLYIVFTQRHHYSLIAVDLNCTLQNGCFYTSFFGLVLVIPVTSFLSSLYYTSNKNLVKPDAESYLIPDISLNDENGIEDSLGYKEIAKEIYGAVNTIYPQRAFTIGINGSWGSGKSSLLYLLEKEIEEHNSKKNFKRKICVLKFDAWAFKDESSLERNFFKVWADGVND